MVRRLFHVQVRPGSRLVAAPGQQRPVGYFQRFGLTAESESEMLTMIGDYVEQDIGGSIVRSENQGEPDFEDLDANIRNVVGDLESRGFWYISGHAFYLKDDDTGDETARPQ